MRISRTVLAITATLALAGCGSTSDTTAGAPTVASPMSSSPAHSMSDDDMKADDMTKAPEAGSYVQGGTSPDPSSYAGTKVVYFFHATWCPDCRATDTSLTGDGVPAGLTVVKVDFDEAQDLKRKYGVTQQHTFIQVGPDGKELGRWTGTRTGAQIAGRTV